MEKTTKIRFKQLSVWLKLSIIIGWLFAVELFFVFLFGFFSALIGGV